MRWQHGGHPMLYFSLCILHLNVLRVPGYYLTLCPWVAADFLFNSVRWQKVRDCAEPLSHTVNTEEHSASILLHFLSLYIQIVTDKV